MTDFTEETRKVCAQNIRFETAIPGSKGDNYKVTFGPENPGDYGANWHCECAGFSYRARCRHVEVAKGQKCDAGWEAFAGSEGIEGDTCPKCGGPVTIIKILT